MYNLDTSKKRMVDCLKLNLGNISKSCEEANICRQTHYNWMESDEEYSRAVADVSEAAIDHVESKLFEKINGVTVQAGEDTYKQPPSDTAIIFYLKTKGKKRGYIEKTEFEHSGAGVNIQVNWPDGD